MFLLYFLLNIIYFICLLIPEFTILDIKHMKYEILQILPLNWDSYVLTTDSNNNK